VRKKYEGLEKLFDRLRRDDERKCKTERQKIEKLESENAELKRRVEELEDEKERATDKNRST